MDKPIVSLPVLLVGILVLAGPQAAVADGAPGNTLVGVWEVGIFPFQNLCDAQPGDFSGAAAVDISVINRDGTMSNSDSTFGTGHGLWRRVANMNHELLLKTPVLGDPMLGQPVDIILTVETKLTLAKGGMTACGTFNGFFDPAHPVFGPFFQGTVIFKRVVLELSESD